MASKWFISKLIASIGVIRISSYFVNPKIHLKDYAYDNKEKRPFYMLSHFRDHLIPLSCF